MLTDCSNWDLQKRQEGPTAALRPSFPVSPRTTECRALPALATVVSHPSRDLPRLLVHWIFGLSRLSL
jgi:hypothetical protein